MGKQETIARFTLQQKTVRLITFLSMGVDVFFTLDPRYVDSDVGNFGCLSCKTMLISK